MHCLTLIFRSFDRSGKVAAGRLVRAAAPLASNESIESIDTRTVWPTHRIRCSLSLQPPISRSGAR